MGLVWKEERLDHHRIVKIEEVEQIALELNTDKNDYTLKIEKFKNRKAEFM